MTIKTKLRCHFVETHEDGSVTAHLSALGVEIEATDGVNFTAEPPDAAIVFRVGAAVAEQFKQGRDYLMGIELSPIDEGTTAA